MDQADIEYEMWAQDMQERNDAWDEHDRQVAAGLKESEA